MIWGSINTPVLDLREESQRAERWCIMTRVSCCSEVTTADRFSVVEDMSACCISGVNARANPEDRTHSMY